MWQHETQTEREDTATAAVCQQDRDRLITQAAEAEFQHTGGGRVKPLRVVHGKDKRRIAGQDAQHVQDSSR